MRFRLAPFVLVVAALVARGAEPKIEGPKQVEPYKVVKLSVTGLDAKAGVLWKVRPLDPKNVPDFGLRGKRNLRDLEFVAPPGGYTVELTIVAPPLGTGEAFSIDELTHPVTIGDAPNPPTPGPNPPVPPAPVPDVDAALSAKYKDALAADMKLSYPSGGSKADALLLSEVYLFTADKLVSTNEADWPKTGEALFTAMKALVDARKIAPTPYLSNVRGVTGDTTGTVRYDESLDAAKRADFAAKLKKCGLALKDAAK